MVQVQLNPQRKFSFPIRKRYHIFFCLFLVLLNNHLVVLHLHHHLRKITSVPSPSVPVVEAQQPLSKRKQKAKLKLEQQQKQAANRCKWIHQQLPI